MKHPSLKGVSRGSDLSAYDALVLVAPTPIARASAALGPELAAIMASLLEVDAALGRGPRPSVVVPASGAPGGRLVLAPMGKLEDDIDDVRSVAETTSEAITRAVDAGARRPLLVVVAPDRPRFERAIDVAALAALGSQWMPLEAREAGKAPPTAEAIGVLDLAPTRADELSAIEIGRALCRDITGTEPERMAPLRIAALCREAFAHTGVHVTIEDDVSGYPLLTAVARASSVVERHRPCVVTLDHRGPGDVTQTIVFAGKGVTYDTGGADLKTDGHMAGMSRDKGGAGAVAGLVRAVAQLNVPGLRVVGLLGLVRNSIGEESFVSDEIVRSRAGVRVRIGNTDAEGRLVLADLLAAGRELVADSPSSVLVSIATLTGHVYRAHGPYVGVIGNHAARELRVLEGLDRAGEAWGEPMEFSRPRREDYAMVAPRSCAEDVVSANRLASVNTPRGYQLPFAFLDIAAGLRPSSVPFIHMDIAGVAVNPPDWQFGRPTGSPIAALVELLRQRF
jgi:leucyl aminopeptidase